MIKTPHPAAIRRVTWTPSRNSERSALASHPGMWVTKAADCNFPRTIRGQPEPCLWIWPVGSMNEGRWVGVSRITLENAPQMELA
jgi:hypothetical protein